MAAGTEILNSSYLDFTGWRLTDATTVVEAYQLDPAEVRLSSWASINVALVLSRNEDPADLLAQDWGARQKMLAEHQTNGTLWTTYGADQSLFDQIVADLEDNYGLRVLDGADPDQHGDYISSAESRTIWVELNTAEDFSALFGTPLYVSGDDDAFAFWEGNLSLPAEWTIEGLWFDTENDPPPSNMAPGLSVELPQGAQSPGNNSTQGAVLTPQAIADLYNFPLNGAEVQTGAIGLIEPGIGSALRPGDTETFKQRLDAYLAGIGLTGTGTVETQGESGQSYDHDAASERSLDVGIVAAVNPNSDIMLFNGSGYNGNADASIFTAIQSSLWDASKRAAVVTSSFGDTQSMSPDSPFFAAYRQLQLDAALKNITLFNALGDGGSGNEAGNGLANVTYNETSPYNIMVGGTSLSTLAAAAADQTIAASLVAPALAGDRAIIWQLMAGGLTSRPTDAASVQSFVETVWNQYYLDGNDITIRNSRFEGGYLVNTTGSGGVDPTQPVPAYQAAYGLNPVSANPTAEVGRGAPDVAANAGGNLAYLVPNAGMTEQTSELGTSAATPLWAALAVQLNTIFDDQGLPALGYMNDLLYIASAIAPAAFNDITIGNNVSSFTLGGSYTSNGTALTPTGIGYSAVPGYDLVTGLGSPNGVLLARALSTIGHAQVTYADSPAMLAQSEGGWVSDATQSLLFQSMSAAGAPITLTLDGQQSLHLTGASDSYAWTNRLAQQSLQADFDPMLVTMFDAASHGALWQTSVTAGADLSLSIGGITAEAIQGTLSSRYGFADFLTDAGAVRVARPVAVAETVAGQDDQTAVLRLRQNGQDSLSLTLYRVDDFNGSIDGLLPGEAGYEVAAASRAYASSTGTTSIAGPGYGNYASVALDGVDSGDLIAMKLVNESSERSFWAFSQANEDLTGHLWSYGLNTWGWEDMEGGGDRDFNDLLVQLDFTSAYGQGWLA
jgi:hypothetical protein